MTALRRATTAEAPTLARIVDRVNGLTEDDLDELDAWDELRDLSSRTELEAVDTGPDNIVLDNQGNFEATADIYVTLNYGPSNEEESMSDGYLATIRGRIEGEDIRIDAINVDVSPFYE
jgi:hypothetical protein